MALRRDLSWLDDDYDVVVIGGGITGVQVARECAGHGVRVLLIEKDDFGQGTSSATTKYIHGGIRYLENYEFGVVRESLRERRLLTLAAPHLLSQRRFVMPAWRWSKPPTALIGAGVGLYSALGYDHNRGLPRSMRSRLPRWWSPARVAREVPWLDRSDLQGAFVYTDTLNVHPERLLLSLVKSAVADGARAMNHVEAVEFVTEPLPNRGGNAIAVTGVAVVDRVGGGHYTVRARTVVNAAGPWMDLVLEQLTRRPGGTSLGVSVRRSKGVHVLCRPLSRGSTMNTVFARAKSGKHVVISPWQDSLFIGPTDTPIDQSPDDVRALEEDVTDLLDTVNSTLNAETAPLTVDDVRDVTVGVRPLIVESGKDSYTTSRRHELYNHGPSGVHNLFSLGGGKWTTARALGEEAARTVLSSAALRGVSTRPFNSRRAGVIDGFGWAVDPQPFLDEAVDGHTNSVLDAATRRHVATLYGTEYPMLLQLAASDPTLGRPVSNDRRCADILAQAVYAVTDEAALELSDIVDRRLTIGTLGEVSRDELQRVADAVAGLLGWSADETDRRVDAEHARRRARRALWRTNG